MSVGDVTEPLPGVDEACLAAGEDEALVRWLTSRCGIDADVARAEVASLDEEDVAALLSEIDCCREDCCEPEPAGRPVQTLIPNRRYL